jgi:hypothetical protein
LEGDAAGAMAVLDHREIFVEETIEAARAAERQPRAFGQLQAHHRGARFCADIAHYLPMRERGRAVSIEAAAQRIGGGEQMFASRDPPMAIEQQLFEFQHTGLQGCLAVLRHSRKGCMTIAVPAAQASLGLPELIVLITLGASPR